MKTIGFVLKPELDEANANQLYYILKNIEELNLNFRYKYITKNFSNPIYFRGVQEAVEHFIDNYSKKTISKITYSNSSYEDDIDKSMVCFFTVKGEFPNFHISSIFQQDQLNQEEIEKIWKKLEEIYWELGGKGYLYAKVTDMNDLMKYGKANNFGRAVFSAGESYPWRILIEEDEYLNEYSRKDYLSAPYHKVKEKGENHLYIQTYDRLFNYMEKPEIDQIEKLLAYLEPKAISMEEYYAHQERLKAKKKEV